MSESVSPCGKFRCTRCGSGGQFPPEHAEWCPHHSIYARGWNEAIEAAASALENESRGAPDKRSLDAAMHAIRRDVLIIRALKKGEPK
jgi:hypothetical protein